MPCITGKDLGLTAVRGRMLHPRDMAPFLGISVRTIEAQMHNGTFSIRWYFMGVKDRVVDSEDFNDFLEKKRVEAGTALLPKKAIKTICKKEEVKA